MGAQRSGTTLLHGLLDAHPRIAMALPARPEPKFFLRDDLYARGLDHYLETFFRHRGAATVLGEKSVSYMESDVAARRIAEALPDAHIVFLLRDPVERALSHHRFSVAHGLEPLPLEEALAREDSRELPPELRRLSMNPWHYRRRGRYVEQMERWAALFPPQRITVLLYERLLEDPEHYRELCRRLGVGDDFDPPRLPPEGPSGPEPPEALVEQLARDYAAPNAALARRWGLDLSGWRRPGG